MHIFARNIICLLTLCSAGAVARGGEPDDSIRVSVSPQSVSLSEVVVTAREGRTPSTSSLIDTTAMRHLQPSSFTELLELLPGGVTRDPKMGSVNTISLRQAAGMSDSDDDYMTSALGTSFVIDGVPVNTSSALQSTPDTNHSGHSSVGRGIDMRAISTDDIAEIEIIRGIASVEYGELTSGLVRIKRKRGVSKLEARFKADSKSRLFYVGKGFSMPGGDWIVNVGTGYLDARIDPRNARENYKRTDASLRSNKRFDSDALRIEWNSAFTYSATFETDNNDPDLTVNGTIDLFSTRNHAFRWDNTLSVNPVIASPLRGMYLTTGISYSSEHLSQERHVASSRVMPMPVSLAPGSNYVNYLPLLYLADLRVEGAPLTIFLKGSADWRFDIGNVISTFRGGIEWNMNKNYGRGNVYEPERPITASITDRPRAFSDIPAMISFPPT